MQQVSKAIAMAMFDSVTVSMGLETMGVFSAILRPSFGCSDFSAA